MWDTTLTRVLAEADAAEDVDWAASVDATVKRAHQLAKTRTRQK